MPVEYTYLENCFPSEEALGNNEFDEWPGGGVTFGVNLSAI